jgi:hypothetical protein
MKLNIFLFLVLIATVLPAQKNIPVPAPKGIYFFVDPKTNSDDPEERMAYGLNVVPPWSDGGYFFINLPEHLWYMPDTKGIARHHDMRKNVWKVSADGKEAGYDVESLTAPGVSLKVNAIAKSDRVEFEMTVTNRSKVFLKSISPLFCFQYHHLNGFSPANADNFTHTYIVVDGKPVLLKDIKVKNPEAVARMAQVRTCEDESNWWAEKMGGMIDQRIDVALTALTSLSDDRKVLLSWSPGKSILSNTVIPCIHADPCIGSLAENESRTIRGTLVFTRDELDMAVAKLTREALGAK